MAAALAALAVSASAHAWETMEAEINCLALNIYHEARGEPEVGRLAVGHVVMNRVSSRSFPGSICAVVQQGGARPLFRCQFSWWCDGRPDDPTDARAWLDSRIMAHIVFTGTSSDPTDGALWYHADYVRPYWKRAFERGPQIGRHIFYRSPADVQQARVPEETRPARARVEMVGGGEPDPTPDS